MAIGEGAAEGAIRPLLDATGQKTWRFGADPRHADVAKIAGDLMLTLAIKAWEGAAALTETCGLKAAELYEIVTDTMFASPSYKRYAGNIGNRSCEPGFRPTLDLEDVGLALDAAKAGHAALPAVIVTRDATTEAVERGFGSKDWSAFRDRETSERQRWSLTRRRVTKANSVFPSFLVRFHALAMACGMSPP